MAPARMGDVARAIPILLAAAKLLGAPVLATEQYPKGLKPTILPVREKLHDLGVVPLEKMAFSAAEVPEFQRRLEGAGPEIRGRRGDGDPCVRLPDGARPPQPEVSKCSFRSTPSPRDVTRIAPLASPFAKELAPSPPASKPSSSIGSARPGATLSARSPSSCGEIRGPAYRVRPAKAACRLSVEPQMGLQSVDSYGAFATSGVPCNPGVEPSARAPAGRTR